MIHVKSDIELCGIRKSAEVNRRVHRAVKEAVAPGIPTKELADLARQELARHGAQSSFLEEGFPDVICISVNEEIGHGVPGTRRLAEQDLVKVDIGVKVDGYHSDCALSYSVGSPAPAVRRLVEATEDALRAGISAVKVGARLSDVSAAVYRVSTAAGYQVVKSAYGHGIGTELHEDPQIPSFGPAGFGPRVRRGMVLAIEPILSSGFATTVVGKDGWTTSTVDGSLAAHVEHTLAVKEDGVEVLTAGDEFMNAWGNPPGNGFVWREKTIADNAALVRLAKQEMDEILLGAWGRPVQPAEILDVEGSEAYVLLDRYGTVRAFCVFVLDAEALYLTTLVVDKSLHGKGLAQWIYRGLIRTARFHGKPAIDLCVQTTNPRAIRFYRKLGFVVTGRPMLNTIAMRCRI